MKILKAKVFNFQRFRNYINEKTQHYICKLMVLFHNILALYDKPFQNLNSQKALMLLTKQHIFDMDYLEHWLRLVLTKNRIKFTFDLEIFSYLSSLLLTLSWTPVCNLYLNPLKRVEPPLNAMFLYNFLLVSIGHIW